MADWKTQQHLEDHWALHRREFPGFSMARYDVSAQETIAVGNRFTYRDWGTHEPRIGYCHRESARFTATDTDGFIRTHYRGDESDMFDFLQSTYRD